MTQVITRYFEDAATARAVRTEMVQRRRFSPRIVDIYTDAGTAAADLGAQQVMDATAGAYAQKLQSGGAVLLVRAGYKPLQVAQTTRDVTAAMGAADMGGLVEEVSVKDPLPEPGTSIFTDHRLILTKERDPDSDNYHMADWPIPLISRRRPTQYYAFSPHARMAAFPIPLIMDLPRFTASIFPRHARMANFPLPLISRRKPFTGSIFGRHARMANFPLPLISRRKPFNRSIFPRHQRMATVPFPLLINQKTGTNALMPGAPRMANFPIRLISHRKPFTGSIFPRHMRMAKFPIPLISRRKPFTGSMIPRHGRMANFPLPLVIKHAEARDAQGGEGFSFSKMIGLKTLTRR